MLCSAYILLILYFITSACLHAIFMFFENKHPQNMASYVFATCASLLYRDMINVCVAAVFIPWIVLELLKKE